MKNLLFIFILFIANSVFSQRNVFDTLTIDKSTKIIGRYPHYDKSKKFIKYNFILEDSIDILGFIKTIKLGKEIENSGEDPNFRISVVKNHKEISGCSINPTLESANTHDGHTYKFDLNHISDLNKKYPFEYYYEKVTFKNEEEYQTYLKKQKTNPNFLFDYAPPFKYEGSFEIEFEKTRKFSSPKAISEFLYPFLDEIVDKKEYRVTYIFNERNKKNNGKSFTMTITGSKKIHENLKIKNLKNEIWKPTIESGWFFFRK